MTAHPPHSNSAHTVRFYETDAVLLDAVSDFLGDGLDVGQPALVIATAPHLDALRQRLQARGLDAASAEQAGGLTCLDAEEALAAFMDADGGMPDESRFVASIATLVRGHVERAGGALRIYGEMVDILWQGGRPEAAIRLEELWNDLARTHPFSLSCAYAMGNFYSEADQTRHIGEIERLHTHVIATTAPPDATAAEPGRSNAAEAEVEHRRRLEKALRGALDSRRSAERLLREREAELRDFVDNALEGLHWVGPDGTILWANRAELEMLGYSHDEYVGRHISEFHVERADIDAILARLARNDAINNYEARMRHKDGSIRHVLITSNVLWRDGEFVHTRCFTRDVTEQKRTDRYFIAQHAVVRVLSEARTLREATPPLLRAICDSRDWKVGALWQVDERANLIRCVDVFLPPGVEAPAFEQVSRDTAFPPAVGLPGRVWSGGTPAWIEDVVRDGNFPRAPYAAAAGLHAAFGFPVRAGGRVIGVIECFSNEVRPPDERLLQLFDAIGTQIGQFIERCQVDEMRARLAAIVESSEDAIVSKTLDGIITSWNPGAERIFGYTASEAVGRHITLIIPSERHAEENEVLARLSRGETIDHFETERRTKDGRIVNISLTVSPVRNSAGEIVGASKVGRDITAAKRAQDDLRRSAEAARMLAEALEKSVRARDEFLATAGHELHNPLNALQLQLVSLLRFAAAPDRPVSPERMRERLGQAVEDVERLVHLVHNLLDVSRITAGRLDLELEEVNLRDLIENVAARLGPQLSADHLTLALEDATGQWDRLRLEQVVMNLLSNAAKYGAGKPIEVRVEADADRASLAVIDHGIGIEADRLGRLFERFERAVSRREYGGFGLGLWIAHNIVKAMGGEISVQSRVGEGSTFTLVLPRRAVAGQPASDGLRQAAAV